MADVGELNYVFPYVTPEPHCIPGYTGYLHGYGPKRIYQMAQTYGRMTHDLMSNHPVSGQRLESIAEAEDTVQRETDKDVWHNEEDTHELKRQDMMPGYTGHIPRKMFQIGKNSSEGSQKAEEEYEQYQKKKSNIPYSFPEQNVFPSRLPGHGVKPYQSNGSQQIPLYTDYRNPMNYNTSPFCNNAMHRKNRYNSPAYSTSLPVKDDNTNAQQMIQPYPLQYHETYLSGRDNGIPFSSSLPKSCYCTCHEQR